MQTPQKNAPQSARRSTKQHGTQSEAHKAAQSDNDAYLVSAQEGDQTPSRKHRKPRKKSNARRNGVQSDVGEMIENYAHKYGDNQDKGKHTPAKPFKSDAYAGPTFHQSPAASALPKPSFLSRSVPNSNPLINTISETADGAADEKEELVKELEQQRETTPLDWMFDAARQSKAVPNGIGSARIMSSASQSPAGRREESDFPFELDGVEDNNSVYSTPLSHRLATSKSPPLSGPTDGRILTDEERRAKADALKKALMNSSAPGQLGPAFNESNPFNAKSVPQQAALPLRHTSNPTTPSYTNGYTPPNNNNTTYFQYGPPSPGRTYNMPQPNRPPSSGLRNVYDPGLRAPLSPLNTGQDMRVSTARSPQPARALNFGAIYGGSVSRPQSEGNPVGHNPKPSLEQGLDDLKKALKMNFLGQA